jgi:hypothetical protein
MPSRAKAEKSARSPLAQEQEAGPRQAQDEPQEEVLQQGPVTSVMSECS